MTRALRIPTLAQRLLLIALGFVAIYATLIPLGVGGGMIAPDLLFCLVIAWVVRRPASAPVLVIVGLGILGDLMMSRPVGLGALGLLLAAEAVRARASTLHGLLFPVEWLTATALFGLVLAGMHVVLKLALADPPGLLGLTRYLVSTALAYPIVAAALALGLGLRAPRHGPGRGRLS